MAGVNTQCYLILLIKLMQANIDKLIFCQFGKMDERKRAAMKILYYVSKCIGLIPFTLRSDKETFECQITKKSVTLSLVVMLVTVFLNICRLRVIYGELTNFYIDSPIPVFVRMTVYFLNFICFLLQHFENTFLFLPARIHSSLGSGT